MASTPGTQSLALGAVNDYIALSRQVNNVLLAIVDLKSREASLNYSGMFSATATYAVNADGTPGSADGTPNPAHPMQGYSLSANQINGFVGYVVNDLFNFLTGVSGPTVADRRPAIHGVLP